MARCDLSLQHLAARGRPQDHTDNIAPYLASWMPSVAVMLPATRKPNECVFCLPQMTEERFAAQRPAGAPPVSVVQTIQESNIWGSLQVDIPIEPANDIVGATLSCKALARLPEDLLRFRSN
jgi:hypothetical protein